MWPSRFVAATEDSRASIEDTLLPKEALEKAKTDAKMLKTSFWPPSRKGHAVEAIASFPLSCI